MKVVGVGGGHGLASTLRAARLYADEIAGVVTVADDGGSSGRLTRELGVPPPGDIRNCLVALSDDEELAALYQHRFQEGALTGHTVGNLMIAALTEMTGDFAAAVAHAGRLLRTQGDVFPVTTDLVKLRGRVGGEVVHGQVAVAQSSAPIQAVYLEPRDPSAYVAAVDAILTADQIVLGPGSLFTSLIAALLVPGIKSALTVSGAHRVFVCNARMQKGETERMDAPAHLDALLAHAGPYCVDTIVLQDPVLESDGVQLAHDRAFADVEVIRADVATDGGHDPQRLAEVLRSLI